MGCQNPKGLPDTLYFLWPEGVVIMIYVPPGIIQVVQSGTMESNPSALQSMHCPGFRDPDQP